jgi:hypothetical protein
VGVDPDQVAVIRRTLTQELLNAVGLPRRWWGKRLLDIALWLPTWRFARKITQFDAEVASLGITTAARNLLQGFVERVDFWGREHVPLEGPVLLACNHPGAYDSFAVVSGLPREDVCVIASGVDFTHSLPSTSRRLIYVTPEASVRMAAVRQGLRHLQQGGILFIFPTGLVDPDPALWPELAFRALHDWSPSIEIFLRRVPETRLVVAITSHVLLEACARSPLTRLVRQDWQRRRLAEYLQIFLQLVSERSFGLAPQVSYAPACTAADLGASKLNLAIQNLAAQALRAHLKRSSLDFHPLSPGAGEGQGSLP